MASFNDVLDALATKLRDYAALKTYCETNFSKAHQVKRRFKKLGGHLSDCPEIQLVTPSRTKIFLVGAKDGRHEVGIFFSFREDDYEKAQTHLVAIDELIDDALISFEPSAIGARQVDINDSASDIGMNHPVYIIASKVTIEHRR